MTIPSEKQLLDAACHFGHRATKWNPKMKPYIYGVRSNVHVFDLSKTKAQLQKVCEDLQNMQKEGKTILFVSTKQQSIPMVEGIGKALGQPMVTKKWIPGLLTNWNTMKQRLRYYKELQDSFRTGDIEKYTKKEQTQLRKELAKLDLALSGVANMSHIPDAIFIVDALRDRVAVLEAAKLGIPVYGICDSNADPDHFTAFIPANDDAVKSISIILSTVQEALIESKPKKKTEDDEEDEEISTKEDSSNRSQFTTL